MLIRQIDIKGISEVRIREVLIMTKDVRTETVIGRYANTHHGNINASNREVLVEILERLMDVGTK